ncbi:MAG: L-threonylcarbamoyladenylate synthase [Betaproteobacteria bacterium]
MRLIDIDTAAALLRDGGVVAFPTETVYGLGADASNPRAIKKVFTAKGRPHDHPLIVHLATHTPLSLWAQNIPATAHALAHAFWPGPLTLILQRHPSVSDWVTGGQDTVALRVPNHPLTQALLSAFGGGLVGPSANRFGQISPTTAAHVLHEAMETIDGVIDGGACTVGIESTIVDLSGSQPTLLRPGHIRADEIEALLGTPLQSPHQHSPRAPGMLAKHYAPHTPILLVEKDLIDTLVRSLTHQGQRVGVLAREALSPFINNIVWLSAGLTPNVYASKLYSNLRYLDEAHCDVLIVESLPLENDWAAPRDRLARAAANERL